MKDVTIIGAGPVGLYASYYATLKGMSVNLVESLEQPGGQVTFLYPEKEVVDLPGFTSIIAQDFIVRLQDQLQPKIDEGLVDVYYENEVVDVIKTENGFKTITKTGLVLESKKLLLTVGNGSFVFRPLGVENEDLYQNISYKVASLNDYQDKDVIICGGGDSALDWALMLEGIAKSVSLVHRRDEFRGKEDTANKIRNSSVQLYLNYTITHVEGENGQAKSIHLKHNQTKELQVVYIDDILVNYGLIPRVNQFKDLPISKTNQGILTDMMGQTNIDGVYACGNASYYEGKQRLITTGLGEVTNVIAKIHLDLK